MPNKNEDKLFKNINDEDARTLLNIIDIESVEVKVWTKELRILDPKDYVPDIILELDFENLIIEIQSTKVNEDFSKRGLTYVSIANRYKENEKEVNLIVLSTAEKSRTVKYSFNKKSIFTYDIVSLKDLDADGIIKEVEYKIKHNLPLGKELIYYALVPMMVEKDRDKYIKRVTHNILQVENSSESIINLTRGVEWLIIDKFLKDCEERDVLCDLLGDRMTLLYEYGERKEQKGRDEGRHEGERNIILGLIGSGFFC